LSGIRVVGGLLYPKLPLPEYAELK